MRTQHKRKTRTLLSEFSTPLGSERLNVRIYRDCGSFVCERELVERDGTSFTMVVPFREAQSLRALLAADPHYPRIRRVALRALANVERAARTHDGWSRA